MNICEHLKVSLLKTLPDKFFTSYYKTVSSCLIFEPACRHLSDDNDDNNEMDEYLMRENITQNFPCLFSCNVKKRADL